jgi:hypothetical protein
MKRLKIFFEIVLIFWNFAERNELFWAVSGGTIVSTDDSESSDEEQDEDYILPSVLEKRLEKNIPLANW